MCILFCICCIVSYSRCVYVALYQHWQHCVVIVCICLVYNIVMTLCIYSCICCILPPNGGPTCPVSRDRCYPYWPFGFNGCIGQETHGVQPAPCVRVQHASDNDFCEGCFGRPLYSGAVAPVLQNCSAALHSAHEFIIRAITALHSAPLHTFALSRAALQRAPLARFADVDQSALQLFPLRRSISMTRSLASRVFRRNSKMKKYMLLPLDGVQMCGLQCSTYRMSLFVSIGKACHCYLWSTRSAAFILPTNRGTSSVCNILSYDVIQHINV